MSQTKKSEVQTLSAAHWLKPEQVERMRDAAHEVGATYLMDRNEALVATMYDTGLRVGEITKVTTDMVELDAGEIFLPSHIQKQYPNDGIPPAKRIELDVDGTIGTNRLLRRYLRSRWKTDAEGLFPSRVDDFMTTRGARDVVSKLAKQAEIRPYTIHGSRGDPDDVSPHVLRHSVAYRLLHERDGFTVYDVRNRLRHASVTTTEKKYDHFETV